MKDALFTIPTAGLLAKVVDMLDEVPIEDRDTKRDLTSRHIIRLMVEMTAPQPL